MVMAGSLEIGKAARLEGESVYRRVVFFQMPGLSVTRNSVVALIGGPVGKETERLNEAFAEADIGQPRPTVDVDPESHVAEW